MHELRRTITKRSSSADRSANLDQDLAGAALRSRGQLDYVAVGAHAQASASLHLLRSANGCWCSTKPCRDRCATTPSDKHMQGNSDPSAKAGRGGHFYQPSRPLSLTIATNLDYPLTNSASGVARCSQRAISMDRARLVRHRARTGPGTRHGLGAQPGTWSLAGPYNGFQPG